MIRAGTVFWIKYRSSKHHLYFVITSARTSDDPVLLVNATTRKSTSDTTCVLLPNAHPRIKKESAVEYGRSMVCRSRDLLELPSTWPDLYQRVEDASPELLRQVQDGALRSLRMIEKHRRLVLTELDRGEGVMAEEREW
jgi:hypothetical protein